MKTARTVSRPDGVRSARQAAIFEKGASLPFALKRCFVISHVPEGKTRGGHMVSCDLFFTVLTGTCRITLRNGRQKISASLSRKTEGLLVHRGTWLRLDRFSRAAIVLVCASQLFQAHPLFAATE